MASLNSYLSVTSTATPISPDSATPPAPDPRQTKILLPKKKPMKWSTGVAPGDYGGPPTTTKLRKYWGGEDDPLTSDDFIWNREFMDRMKKLIQEPNSSIQSTPVKEKPSGFLSINRVMSLDGYGVGLLGSIVYMRMLGSSVDSMADGARGLLKGAIGQPRLLVPVVLVMIFNRWNGIVVPQYGFMHLELIPMLVGFFTYKVATFIQAIEEALPAVEKET